MDGKSTLSEVTSWWSLPWLTPSASKPSHGRRLGVCVRWFWGPLEANLGWASENRQKNHCVLGYVKKLMLGHLINLMKKTIGVQDMLKNVDVESKPNISFSKFYVRICWNTAIWNAKRGAPNAKIPSRRRKTHRICLPCWMGIYPPVNVDRWCGKPLGFVSPLENSWLLFMVYFPHLH